MLFDTLNATSLPVLGLVLVAAILLCAEVGLLIGRRARTAGDDKDAGNMAAAALGLLALLIAFTYSMALNRYDQRRSLVLQEANAIGSTANYALMLPAEAQATTLAILKQYSELRAELGTPFDPDKLDRDAARSNAMLGQLWQGAVALSNAAPQSLPLHRYASSLSDVGNMAEARVTALRNHVPVVILVMLVTTALVAMGFVGYSTGVGGTRRQVPIAIMSVLLAFLIVITQDLARPDRGSIEISKQPLRDAIAAMPSAPR